MKKGVLTVAKNGSPLNFRQYWQSKKDRTVLYSAVSTPFSGLLALTKLVIGFAVMSMWLLGFGCFYLVMVVAKGWLFYRYSKLRINEREVTDDPDFALSEYFSAGLFFIGLGAIFAVFCLSMYFNGYHQHFSANVTYIIALIGFVKIINSSISLVRSRKHHNHLITILKLFNVVDGAVAIVLTQYAILTLERSANANSSSGLFGFGIGIVIVILGVWFLVRSRQRGADNGRQGLDDEHR